MIIKVMEGDFEENAEGVHALYAAVSGGIKLNAFNLRQVNPYLAADLVPHDNLVFHERPVLLELDNKAVVEVDDDVQAFDVHVLLKQFFEVLLDHTVVIPPKVFICVCASGGK
jgi:hypothetical protein